jgi:tetratricopeptide (TPR) repeat protein
MKLLLASAGLVALLASSAEAAPEIQQIIYNVSATTRCSDAAAGFGDMKEGLAFCDIALSDPQMIHRAELMVDRGVIQTRLGDNAAALSDYNGAIALNAGLGDAYISRAGVLVAMKRYEEARADIAQGLALNATNLHAAYYSRGVIEEESGDVKAAYRDYNQALAIKPDFAPASRELTRFRKVGRTSRG